MADTPLTQETVNTALREVLCPGTTRDIVSIDLVGEVVVDGGDVVVEIVQTSEKDETIAAIQEAVGEKLSNLLGVSSVRVDIRRPEPLESHGHNHGAAAELHPPEPLAGVDRIIAVASALSNNK
ncbi:MAG: iron-sulfur cluster assembly protein [bacterium]